MEFVNRYLGEQIQSAPVLEVLPLLDVKWRLKIDT